MSDITLTYKGETIGTMDATGTKTLKTAGKYCEGDIGIAYVKQSEWSWMGVNPTVVKTGSDSYNLDNDTSFSSWTPSTTPQIILASAAVGTFEADMANYDYIIQWLLSGNMSYPQVPLVLANGLRITKQRVYHSLQRKADTYAHYMDDVLTLNDVAYLFSVSKSVYKDANNANQIAYAKAGFYLSENAAPTFSSASADNPTVTLYRPDLIARCDSEYMSTTSMGQLGATRTDITIGYNVIRVDKPGIIESEYLA